MARRVVRRTTDWDSRVGSKPARWTMNHSEWREVSVYRIEWSDGGHTGSGLFASYEAAERYATERGWMLDIEHEEECA